MLKYILILILAANCLTGAAFAQAPEDPNLTKPYPLLMNTGGRSTTSLDGLWKTIMDPFETGYYNYRYQPNEEGFFKNRKPKDKTELIEYDFDASESLRVPGDWNTQKSELLWYEGTIWYKKSFTVHKKPGRRLFLYFGAVNYEAKVYVNGEMAGQHEGGFTPFNFEVTGLVKEGENFVVIKADNQRRRDGVPTINTDWWNYGGLTRSVELIETSATFIRDYAMQLKKGSMQQVEGYVQLDGAAASRQVTIRIPEIKLTKIVRTDENGYAKLDLTQKFDLWSPENPKLYQVHIATDHDTIIDRIGFRSIETKGQDILLNGKSVFLRGICIHEEAPFRSARAYSVEDAHTLLTWAKELGCNYVRLAHYPHNENMIREADRLGLMVWSEIPLYWTIQWENPRVLENAKNQFSEMYSRDKNRASVILWSLANETPLGDARLKFLTTLAGYIRSLDKTRLLTAALESHSEPSDPNTILVNDPLGEYLDVLGCNEYFGWYNGLPDKANSLTWKTTYNKPLIMSEFGAESVAGRHGDRLERWTEDYQQYFFTENLNMLKKIPFLRGTTPWLLMDFRSPKRQLAGVQDYYNRKGLISDKGQRKKAFYTMQNYYKLMQQQFQAK